MQKWILGGLLVLSVTMGAALWAIEPKRKRADLRAPAQAAPMGKKEVAQDTKTSDPTHAIAGSVPRLEVKKPTPPHLTEAQDRASERAIRAQEAALNAEYNAKNTEAFADHFLPNAEYELDSGEVIVGRPAIKKHFLESFENNPDARVTEKSSTIRLISLHTAIEEGSDMIAATPDDPPTEIKHVAIWAFNEGRWCVAAMRELASEPAVNTSHAQLEPLAWLVGDWVNESPETLVKTSCRWSDDENFLLLDFTVRVGGSSHRTGTQRIGWDPLTRKLRAWTFDSQGGYGESFWNWDGEQWLIRSSVVSASGAIETSINYLIPVNQDKFRWESSHRMADDKPLPDASVLIVRQAPPPKEDVAENP